MHKYLKFYRWVKILGNLLNWIKDRMKFKILRLPSDCIHPAQHAKNLETFKASQNLPAQKSFIARNSLKINQKLHFKTVIVIKKWFHLWQIIVKIELCFLYKI
jgi:hypothetical protein